MNDGKGLCGANDWRLPTHSELLSILVLDGANGLPYDSDVFYLPHTFRSILTSNVPINTNPNRRQVLSIKITRDNGSNPQTYRLKLNEKPLVFFNGEKYGGGFMHIIPVRGQAE